MNRKSTPKYYVTNYIKLNLETNTTQINNKIKMIRHFRESQDFYSILHFSLLEGKSSPKAEPIILSMPKNLRDYWSINKQEWFSHRNVDVWDLIHTVYENVTGFNIHLLLQYDQLNRHPMTEQFETEYKDDMDKFRSQKQIQHRFATQLAFQMIHNGQYDELEHHEKIFTLLAIRHNPNKTLKYFVLSKIHKELARIHTQNEEQSQWLRFLSATILDIDKCKRTQQFFHAEPLIETTERYLLNSRDVITNFEEVWHSIHYGFDSSGYKTLNQFQDIAIPVCESLILSHIGEKRKIAISISGGVDSMVLSNIARGICERHNIQMVLLHIRYNNRDCCENETDLLRYWAKVLDVPLYIRNIDELTRNRASQYRTMYEDVTRRIRFGFYDYFDCPVMLGHNRDDTFENMFSNLSKNIHFDNLKGMKPHTVESDITILRPFLSIDKELIVKYAEASNIPYLEDSTPPWSRRGKTRDELMPAISEFDSHILPGLESFVEYTSFLHNQWNLSFQKWISGPQIERNEKTQNVKIIRDEFFNTNYINIMFWTKLWFELKLPTRPSNKSFKNIVDCLRRNKEIKCTVNKYFNIIIRDSNVEIERK